MPEPAGAEADRVTRRFIIKGRVQGVYFRHSTRLEAQRLGVQGIARNLDDGSVEVIAHGPAAAVERLREWLHRGPSAARVDGVEEPSSGEEDASAGADAMRDGFASFSVE